MKKITLFILIAVTIIANNSMAQVVGCTDPNANNFNEMATVNDGSCTYNVTLYNPPIKYLLPDEIKESSGLAYYNNRLWTINDSGGLPILYAFDTLTGEVVQRLSVMGSNID